MVLEEADEPVGEEGLHGCAIRRLDVALFGEDGGVVELQGGELKACSRTFSSRALVAKASKTTLGM